MKSNPTILVTGASAQLVRASVVGDDLSMSIVDVCGGLVLSVTHQMKGIILIHILLL